MNISVIKNLQWVDYFIYSLTDPRMLYKLIANKSPESFRLSFAVPVLVCFCDVIALTVLSGDFWASFISYAIVLSIMLSLFMNLIFTGIIDFLSQMMGHAGNAKSTFVLINFSFLPKAFILPIALIFSISGFAPVFFYFLFSAIFLVWAAINVICGISEMRSISGGKATLIYFSPTIICMSVLFFTMLIFVTGVLKSLGI